MRRLTLRRPLAVLDLETTGTSQERDRIVELALLAVHPDGTRQRAVTRVNPGVPIPRAATEVHGIADRDVAGLPPFRAHAPDLARALAACDLAGFNLLAYDLPLLTAEFQRAGVAAGPAGCALVDAMAIFHERELAFPGRRTLAAAVAFSCGRRHDGAHSAAADAEAALAVLEGQLARYPDLPGDVPGLAAWCRAARAAWLDPEGRLRLRDGEAVLAFGKYAGVPLREVARRDAGYLEWTLRTGFSDEVLEVVARALQGAFPARP